MISKLVAAQIRGHVRQNRVHYPSSSPPSSSSSFSILFLFLIFGFKSLSKRGLGAFVGEIPLYEHHALQWQHGPYVNADNLASSYWG